MDQPASNTKKKQRFTLGAISLFTLMTLAVGLLSFLFGLVISQCSSFELLLVNGVWYGGLGALTANSLVVILISVLYRFSLQPWPVLHVLMMAISIALFIGGLLGIVWYTAGIPACTAPIRDTTALLVV